MSDRQILCDVLALFTAPEVELRAADVSSLVWVERSPSRWLLPLTSAQEALNDLARHGYLAKRRAKTNLYRRDPADVRPSLPPGFLYERRPSAHGIVTWITTPRYRVQGGVVALVLVGEEAASSDIFYDLTSAAQSAKALTESEATARLKVLVARRAAYRLVGREIRASIADADAVRALANLVGDASYKGASLGV